jgi:hypothetical protein
MLTFPTALFAPSGLKASLQGVAKDGGQSLSGITQYAMTTGGGFWTFDMDEAVLWDTNKFNVWEAVAARADNGATPFVVPVCERRRQPFGNPKRPPPIGFFDDSVFADGALWAGELCSAVLTGTAALRATLISFTHSFPAGAFLRGGEHFTVWYPTRGQRMHRITRVLSDADGTASVEIRPPLREACAADTPLDFDNPRCVMLCPGDMGALLEMFKRGKSPKVRFVESFAPVEPGYS